MAEKNAFVERFKKRTKKFGVDVILFCESLKRCKASISNFCTISCQQTHSGIHINAFSHSCIYALKHSRIHALKHSCIKAFMH
jgi:hypothetical protein